MDHLKLENFERSHSVPFPEYRHLAADEASALRYLLGARASVAPSGDLLRFTRELLRGAVPHGGVRATAESFSLQEVMDQAGITPAANVFINWHRFDDIDEIKFEDLATYFDDIWYPSLDDIEVFDASCRWLISIDHDGAVRVARWS